MTGRSFLLALIMVFIPHGIHAAIWNEIDPSSPFAFPDKRHLTAVSYHALRPPVAYVEPMAVGLALPLMPLFLDSNRYVNLPLEPTYTASPILGGYGI